MTPDAPSPKTCCKCRWHQSTVAVGACWCAWAYPSLKGLPAQASQGQTGQVVGQTGQRIARQVENLQAISQIKNLARKPGQTAIAVQPVDAFELAGAQLGEGVCGVKHEPADSKPPCGKICHQTKALCLDYQIGQALSGHVWHALVQGSIQGLHQTPPPAKLIPAGAGLRP